MSSSSLGSPQSLNLYAYVQNNPIDFVDPSGLLCYWIDLGERGYIYDCSPGNRPGIEEPPVKDPGRGGGGGGGGAEKKPCNITVRAGGNQSSDNVDPLDSVNAGGRKLGPVEGFVAFDVGWFTKVEIRATVQGDANKWIYGQMANNRINYNGVGDNGGIFAIMNERELKWNDDPADSSTTIGSNKIIWNDNPGVRKNFKDKSGNQFTVENASIKQRFISFVTNGKDSCTVSWETSLEIRGGKIVSSGFSITGTSNNTRMVNGILRNRK